MSIEVRRHELVAGHRYRVHLKHPDKEPLLAIGEMPSVVEGVYRGVRVDLLLHTWGEGDTTFSTNIRMEFEVPCDCSSPCGGPHTWSFPIVEGVDPDSEGVEPLDDVWETLPPLSENAQRLLATLADIEDVRSLD